MVHNIKMFLAFIFICFFTFKKYMSMISKIELWRDAKFFPNNFADKMSKIFNKKYNNILKLIIEIQNNSLSTEQQRKQLFKKYFNKNDSHQKIFKIISEFCFPRLKINYKIKSIKYITQFKSLKDVLVHYKQIMHMHIINIKQHRNNKKSIDNAKELMQCFTIIEIFLFNAKKFYYQQNINIENKILFHKNKIKVILSWFQYKKILAKIKTFIIRIFTKSLKAHLKSFVCLFFTCTTNWQLLSLFNFI
ncbi:MAG: hypothetical protein QFY14_01260 [Candidatus Phytoplasma pruni]|nr:hypothetical protein [Candidatus Phytoplasma pruni]